MSLFNVPSEIKAAPYKQAIAVLLVCVLGMFSAKIFNKSGEMEWIIACVGIVFFSWINPMLYIFQDKWLPYIGQSIVMFILLSISLLFAAKFISVDALSQHKSYRMLIMLSLLFFLITSIVAKVIRTIYAFTSKQF